MLEHGGVEHLRLQHKPRQSVAMAQEQAALSSATACA
jgi:hypothetical protein